MSLLRTYEELLDALGPVPTGAWVASDADGTLWAADVAEDAWNLALRERLFRPEAGPPLARILSEAGGEPTGEPHADASAIWEAFLAGRVPDGPILRAMAACFAGLSEDEARAFADRVYEELLAPHVYSETLPLYRALAERGASLVVVSGSPTFLVAGALRGMGLVGETRGVTLARQDGVLTAEVLEPITWNAGKIEAVAPLVGEGGAWLALGDSPGDFELLVSAQRRVMVHPRATLTAKAGEGWLHFVPERTVNGEAVRRPSADAWG